MNKVKVLIILLLLLLGQGESLFAQFQCGTPSPTDQQKQELIQLFQQFTQQKKARRITNYRVAVKANVVSGMNASSFLSETDVREIINYANVYLQNINIELYL